MIATLVDVFAADSVLLVFVVMAAAAALGSIRLKGVALGPAAALFVGLGVGAIDESLSGAAGLAQLRELGLALFAYTLGLASGPAFFGGLRRGGLGAAALTVTLIGGLAGACAVAAARARPPCCRPRWPVRREHHQHAGAPGRDRGGCRWRPGRGVLAHLSVRSAGDAADVDPAARPETAAACTADATTCAAARRTDRQLDRARLASTVCPTFAELGDRYPRRPLQPDRTRRRGRRGQREAAPRCR